MNPLKKKKNFNNNYKWKKLEASSNYSKKDNWRCVSISPYLVRMRENKGQKNSE